MENLMGEVKNRVLALLNEAISFVSEFLSTHVGPGELGVVVVILVVILILFNL